MVDFIAFLLLAVLIYHGWRRGTVGMALGVGALLAGYAAAFFLYRPIGGMLSAALPLSPVAAYAVGGGLAMVVVAGSVRVFASFHRRARKRRIERGWQPSPLDEAGGAVLGLGFGMALLVFLGWAVSALGGVTGTVNTRGSVVAQASADVVEALVRVSAQRASGDEFVASSLAVLVADPSGGIEVVEQLLRDERVRDIARDPAMVEAVTNGRPELLAQDTRVRDLAADPGFLASVRRVGLVGPGSGPVSADELAGGIVELMGPVMRTAEALAQDPDVMATVRSPRVTEALDGGNLLDLLKLEEIQGLFAQALRELRAEG